MTDTVTAPHSPRTGKRAAPSGRGRRALIIISFLAPALVVLGALVVYPIVFTLVRSFYDRGGDAFIGFQNYLTMFTNDTTFTAIRNNILWVIVAPLVCTILGLIFAVLLEKLKWKTAFRLIIFMPLAISMLAAGVIFRGLFQENPQLGAVNAGIVGIQSVFEDSSYFPGAKIREGHGVVMEQSVMVTEGEVAPGSSVNFPLTAVRQTSLPEDAAQAAPAPEAGGDQVTGTVFLDVVPGGGGEQGQIDEGTSGLPGIRVDAMTVDGDVAAHTITASDGTFTLEGLDSAQTYRIALPASNFSEGPTGVSWLSATFINAVVILAYIWIWAGFAMVMIASGLSAMDRSLQEAARMDGATEWQVFSRITAPLLTPVLLVVLVTLIINVLKIFDLVYVIPPGVSRPAANVIAVEMWTVSFGGGNDYGLGSALAILLLILVLPSMILNVKRFREERRA